MSGLFFARDLGTITFGSAQKLTCDERHHAWNADAGFEDFMGIGFNP